jgi:mono/diheme cytochrome c family protein
MRDHLNLLTQARDALIRGQLVDATGALTWLAQHREPKASASARPFLDRLHQHAQGALDSADLRGASQAVGALAATCGDCHAARGGGPKLEPSGLENIDEELTVATHMRAYFWVSETLWNALVADNSELWKTGVATLTALKPPARPRKLGLDFGAIQAWAKAAPTSADSAALGSAYGRLIEACATCHVEHGVEPGRTRESPP